MQDMLLNILFGDQAGTRAPCWDLACPWPRLSLPLLVRGERGELFPSKGQQLGKLQAWGTSSPILSCTHEPSVWL